MAVTPRVSIVLAAHDQARWLPATIATVRAQTFGDWELLLVDDGSTDETAAVVVAAAADDPRIRYLPGARAERAAARNRGLAAARGELVAFLDGDDLWHPTKLARQVARLDATPDAGVCYTIARFVDAQERPLPVRKPPHPIDGAVFAVAMRANFVILASVMVRRALLAEVGGFDAGITPMGCEDWDLWLRLARRTRWCVVDDELTRYRVHENNTAAAQILASGLSVIDRHYDDPDTARRAGLSRDAARARLLWYHAGAATAVDRRRALGLAARALAAAPRAAWSRPAAGTLAGLFLPAGVRRWLVRADPPPAEHAARAS